VLTQTRHAGQPKSGASPFPLNAAREAYVRSDYSAVLDLLAAVRIGEPAPVEAWLLRGRALLRLHRPDDVVAELTPLLPTIRDVDERTTAAMLHGAALARLVPARGIAVLAAIADTAQRERAHAAVRAEISYYRAVAHWTADELDRAEERARDAQRNGRDVLTVRAMQLRAWIAEARPTPTRFADALTIWQNAGRAYARCRERDLDLAAMIVHKTASLEQTLRSADVRGGHRSARGSRTAPGSPFPARTPSALYALLCYDDAWLFGLDGDVVTALAKMRDAEEASPAPAWRVWARSGSALIAAFFGENGSARAAADEATALAQAIDWNTAPDERLAFLHLAETYAYVGDAAEATAALRRFDEMAPPMDATRMLHRANRDPRFVGWYAHVLGLVRRGEGDLASATAAFSAAVQAFRSCGYLWREAVSLIELGVLPAMNESGGNLERAVSLVRQNFPESFVGRRLQPWARAAADPLVGTLTAAERDILMHILEGRTHQEIADLTGRALNTVRAHMQGVHRKLGTSSNAQIIVACARRGIGAPSWRFSA